MVHFENWSWKDTLSAAGFLIAAFLIFVIYSFISAKISESREKRSGPAKKGGKELSQEQLIRKYEKTKDDHKRNELVKLITDADTLAKIAVSDTYTSARCNAVVRIDDQKILSGIAENDGDPLVRHEAVGKLTDQALLERIAVHDGKDYVRQRAAMGIRDPQLLKKFAMGQDAAAATGAVRVIEDSDFLEQLARSAEASDNVRKAAVQRLKELPQ